jgi:hypothetical protein
MNSYTYLLQGKLGTVNLVRMKEYMIQGKVTLGLIVIR